MINTALLRPTNVLAIGAMLIFVAVLLYAATALTGSIGS